MCPLNPLDQNKKPYALLVKDLRIGYTHKNKGLTIAKGINFALVPGELAAIVGVNGIGKSTLLRTLCAMQPTLGGKIMLNGTFLAQYSQHTLATCVSVVLTERDFSKNLTVSELIALGRQPHTNWLGTFTKIDYEKVDEASELLELNDLRHKKCHGLSDGQLQRVLIARALAQDTPLMLLDEPTSHLDLYHKVHILKLLRNIAHQTKKTILFTSHEIEMAIQLCDKMVVLNGTDNPFSQPCELIAQKAFDDLFPKGSVSFDPTTGTFRVKK